VGKAVALGPAAGTASSSSSIMSAQEVSHGA